MSNLTDSLRESDDNEFKSFLLERLSQAEEKVEPFALLTSPERYPMAAYWQGQKDALRSVLAMYLNEPVLGGLKGSSRISQAFQFSDEEAKK